MFVRISKMCLIFGKSCLEKQVWEVPHCPFFFYECGSINYMLDFFWRQGLIMQAKLVWNPGWVSCLCLLRAEITGVSYHAQLHSLCIKNLYTGTADDLTDKGACCQVCLTS